ncbi:MAG: MotA/TolQ/ExbB proton channel family protein [Oligoflexia bacterium]|nr:MotA/TolQ/ExbB proton channel family protein [Oligoflexia bacterium]
MNGFFEFIRTSFWHVAPILIAGAVALAIMAERARALFGVYPIRDMQGFFDKITDLVLAGKFGDAIALCDRLQAKPVARVTKEALLRAHQPESLIENGLQIAVSNAIQSIQKRTTFLSMIANVATLLGLLGTIAGLIASFEAVGHADPQQKSALLAAGISTAMNATMMGLGVAIPCMVAFSFLMNRTNRLLAEIEQSAMRSLDILKQRYYQAESAVSSGNEHGSKVVELQARRAA